ncbi:protein unc-93 homolog A isoform X1 [Vicugna pacos]|uniref:Protein unc-93 homolog A n=2 Tax=Vicugna pacos TaxID=30538 RepID=A0A6J0AUG9_VICPA|nr:protein unc-93 homolog A [Vicugna pacos]XP_015103069.1 protein unc-93 homolog A [Vicugna pacos]XP_031535739.1 protein unc-93 homolog A [Vicugna pacos]XP_031535740.1 protein unc-93 homolog A [Vicugna pacos]XP_031535741.1 protein unc-93 homolog A [Vicugna pacos]
MDRSLRNVLVVSLGFLLLFTAYGGLQNLQSSLYSEAGLGVAALSTLYCGMLLSSMFLPPVLIQKLGCKWTIVTSMCCYVAFSLGNFYASWYTLVPTSVLLGLGAAPLWSAQGTYLTIMGNAHAEKAGKAGKDVVNQYFGIFFLIFQSSGVWGNLISSLVFGQTPTHGAVPEEQLLSCGASDCLMATASSNSTSHPSQELIYTLLGIYTGSGVLAVLLTAVLLEPVKGAQRTREGKERAPRTWSALLSTFKLFRDKRLRLLVLLPLYSGFEQAFLAGDYTRSYATCALGIQYVGYVMICFAAVNALCSLLYGKLAAHTGRTALFALGAATHLSCILALLLWRPHPSQLAVFFVLSGLWGVADAVWQTQNNALYGVLFEDNKEAAFANYRLWEALGFVIAFGYSSFLCVSVKLYILLGVLSLAMVAYGVVECLESRKLTRPLAVRQTKPEEEGETQTKM